MTGQLDPAMKRALDRLEPPPLSSDFADRVVAATEVRAATPRRRDPRGPWSRGRQAAVGAMVVTLMSATAAAAGLFGEIGVTVPALERFVERVALARPEDPPALVPTPNRVAVVEVKAEPVADPVEAVAETPARPTTVREVRREVAARRIAAGIELRIARRERLGLPVDPRLRDLSLRPGADAAARFPERAALAERVQEIRRARRDGTLAAAPEAAPGDASPRRRWRDLSPEQRAEARRRLLELRRQRLAESEGFSGPLR